MSAEPEPTSTTPTSDNNREGDAPNIGPEDDVLRNAPTFVDDEKNGTANMPTAAEGTTTTTTATPKPGIAEKIITKLGLNPIMLMSMFKSVVPTRSITLSSMRADMDPSFVVCDCVEHRSHL